VDKEVPVHPEQSISRRMKKEVNAFGLGYAAITRKRQRVDPVDR
jgi:hypothetical protein